jgi:hypothetical protein
MQRCVIERVSYDSDGAAIAAELAHRLHNKGLSYPAWGHMAAAMWMPNTPAFICLHCCSWRISAPHANHEGVAARPPRGAAKATDH